MDFGFWIDRDRKSWWHGFGSMGCVGHGFGSVGYVGHRSSGGLGVVDQVGLWCGVWWVFLGYLMVVLLGLGVECVASLVAPMVASLVALFMAPMVIFFFKWVC